MAGLEELWLSDCKHSVQARVAPWLQPVAEEGNLYAQFLYGEACKAGRYGVARDVAKGAEYLERAEELKEQIDKARNAARN